VVGGMGWYEGNDMGGRGGAVGSMEVAILEVEGGLLVVWRWRYWR